MLETFDDPPNSDLIEAIPEPRPRCSSTFFEPSFSLALSERSTPFLMLTSPPRRGGLFRFKSGRSRVRRPASAICMTLRVKNYDVHRRHARTQQLQGINLKCTAHCRAKGVATCPRLTAENAIREGKSTRATAGTIADISRRRV